MAGSQACLIYVMIVIQIMGILSVVMIGLWLGAHSSDKGFGFKDSKKLLNMHGLFMPIGAYVTSNGVVMYRAFRKYPAKNVKWIHILFQFAAVVIFVMGFSFSVVARNKQGFKAEQHQGLDKEVIINDTEVHAPVTLREIGEPKHFYSAHAWLGLMFFVMLCLQFLAGLLVFAFKAVNKASRELFAAVHAFFGIFITILSGFVAVIGIQSLAKSEITEYDKLVQAGVLANVGALAIIIMLAHVLYISVNPFFEWDVNDDTLEANPIE